MIILTIKNYDDLKLSLYYKKNNINTSQNNKVNTHYMSISNYELYIEIGKSIFICNYIKK